MLLFTLICANDRLSHMVSIAVVNPLICIVTCTMLGPVYVHLASAANVVLDMLVSCL